MPDSPGVTFRVPVHASHAGARGTTVVGIGFLLLVLVKPWGTSDAAPAASRTAPSGTSLSAVRSEPAASQSPPLPSAGPSEIVCAPSGWQVVTLDRMADWTVRTWIPAAPVPATGPLDPIIPTIRLESPDVVAIGVCGSSDPGNSDLSASRATLVVAAWDTSPGRFRSLGVSTAQGDHVDARVARLYAPVHSLNTLAMWPTGRFVFELAPIAIAEPAVGVSSTPLRWYIAVTVSDSAPPA